MSPQHQPPQHQPPRQETLPTIHHIKVTLRDVRPAVWRQLQVPSAITLGELSDLLLDVFEWDGGHLHEFEVRGTRFGPSGSSDDVPAFFGREVRDEDSATLAQVAARPGSVLEYTYDFGDDWRHRIEVQEVLPVDLDGVYPRCLGGRGVAPEEDTGAVRGSTFDRGDVEFLNQSLQARPDAMHGRDLATAAAARPARDPVFADLFPGYGPGDVGCDCGQQHDVLALRPYHPVTEQQLSELALASPLVRRAMALAQWVGPDRALTPNRLLRPADARRAVAELDLSTAVLTPPGHAPQHDHDHDPGHDRSGRGPGADKQIRSAKDLPGLHAMWSAAVGAGLIEIRATRAGIGKAAQIWHDGGDPAQRLDGWARLVAGYLQARVESSNSQGRFRQAPKAEMLAMSVQVLHLMARDPIPAAAPALLLAAGGDDPLASMFGTVRPLFEAMDDVAQDWAVAGVVADSRTGGATGDPGSPGEGSLVADLLEGLTGAQPPVQLIVAPMVDAVAASPIIQLTPLGDYAMYRILTAHGWTVPVLGDCVDLTPSQLLERLEEYPLEDAVAESDLWLQARGAEWRSALTELAECARTPDRSHGPAQRTILRAVLHQAGPRIEPLLSDWASDPWLGSSSATVRHGLGLGPEPTLAEQLWVAIDQLSPVIDVEDEDEAAQLATFSELQGLISRSGAITTAITVPHPDARDTLRVLADALYDRLDHRGTAQQLRHALTSTRTPGRTQGPTSNWAPAGVSRPKPKRR